MPVALATIVQHLNEYLRVDQVADGPDALNGLQVDGPDSVATVVAAVDACQASIDAAGEAGADLLVVHHGLFWGGVQPLVGRHSKRIRALMASNVALYSAHLPLDLHPEVGNNVLLGRMVGLEDVGCFGEYLGQMIGVIGRLETRVDDLVGRLETELHTSAHVMSCGPSVTKRVAIVSGGAGSMIRDAYDAGADTFITGEGAHHTYFEAEERGMNVIYAGHYATETVGVRALTERVAGRFDLAWHFFDHPTGL